MFWARARGSHHSDPQLGQRPLGSEMALVDPGSLGLQISTCLQSDSSSTSPVCFHPSLNSSDLGFGASAFLFWTTVSQPRCRFGRQQSAHFVKWPATHSRTPELPTRQRDLLQPTRRETCPTGFHRGPGGSLKSLCTPLGRLLFFFLQHVFKRLAGQRSAKRWKTSEEKQTTNEKKKNEKLKN